MFVENSSKVTKKIIMRADIMLDKQGYALIEEAAVIVYN